jgi:hypothetical protein
MPNNRIDVTAAKAVQTQLREDQRRYTQPNTPAADEDKGGKILAQPAKGTKKQLLATIAILAALIADLALLAAFHVI